MRKKVQPLSAALLAAVLVMPITAPLACAVPQGVDISPADSERMARFDEARISGLAEAMLGENESERQTVSDLFISPLLAIETIPDGNYRCRTIKLGGLLPLVTYGYFACTISEAGTVIEKTSGSQRFSGSLTPADGALFYRGALHYNDDPLLAYDQDPEQNQVGCLVKLADREVYRLEMPYPLRESTHDVIELVPAD